MDNLTKCSCFSQVRRPFAFACAADAPLSTVMAGILVLLLTLSQNAGAAFGMDVSYWDAWAEQYAVPFTARHTVKHAAIVHITCAALLLFSCAEQVEKQN